MDNSGIAPDNLKSTDLRAYLKQNGVSEDLLKNYDDATLQSLYQKLVESKVARQLHPSTTGSGIPAPAVPLQKVKLTPEQKQ